jgi:hypothetical protein
MTSERYKAQQDEIREIQGASKISIDLNPDLSYQHSGFTNV